MKGSELRGLRKSLGLTQQEMAAQLDSYRPAHHRRKRKHAQPPRAFYGRWECGVSEIPESVAQRARVLAATPRALVREMQGPELRSIRKALGLTLREMAARVDSYRSTRGYTELRTDACRRSTYERWEYGTRGVPRGVARRARELAKAAGADARATNDRTGETVGEQGRQAQMSGAELGSLRESLGLNLEQMAAMLGRWKPTYRRYETGAFKISESLANEARAMVVAASSPRSLAAPSASVDVRGSREELAGAPARAEQERRERDSLLRDRLRERREQDALVTMSVGSATTAPRDSRRSSRLSGVREAGELGRDAVHLAGPGTVALRRHAKQMGLSGRVTRQCWECGRAVPSGPRCRSCISTIRDARFPEGKKRRAELAKVALAALSPRVWALARERQLRAEPPQRDAPLRHQPRDVPAPLRGILVGAACPDGLLEVEDAVEAPSAKESSASKKRACADGWQRSGSRPFVQPGGGVSMPISSSEITSSEAFRLLDRVIAGAEPEQVPGLAMALTARLGTLAAGMARAVPSPVLAAAAAAAAAAAPSSPAEPRWLSTDEAVSMLGGKIKRKVLYRVTRGMKFRKDLTRKSVLWEEAGLRRWVESRRS